MKCCIDPVKEEAVIFLCKMDKDFLNKGAVAETLWTNAVVKEMSVRTGK